MPNFLLDQPEPSYTTIHSSSIGNATFLFERCHDFATHRRAISRKIAHPHPLMSQPQAFPTNLEVCEDETISPARHRNRFFSSTRAACAAARSSRKGPSR